jgi:hypothetical protein
MHGSAHREPKYFLTWGLDLTCKRSQIYNLWPLVGIINNATFENVRMTAIVLMEIKAKGLKKLELRRDLWGCKGRKVQKVYIP